MNAKHLLTAVAVLVSASSAFAQEYVVPDAGFVSTKSRAEVVAEISQAQADGSLTFVEHNYPVVQFASSKSRAEVLAELDQARVDGSLNFVEHSYPVLSADNSQTTRAQVQAELAQYRAERPYGDLNQSYAGVR